MRMICPHCKEQFLISRGIMKDYVYKIGNKYFCSYTCWRAKGGNG